MAKEESNALPKSFDDLIQKSDKPVLVDFWAEGSVHCKTVSPIMAEIAKEYSGRLFAVKINIDKKPDVAAHYQVKGVPTIMMFWKGQSLLRIVGAQSKAQIKLQIDLRLPKD